MQSLKIGHYTNQEQGTGLTAFLFYQPAVATYYLCGSSPATRELHILEPEAGVTEVHGLLLSGGSAFGLGAANGVMQFLHEQGIGKQMNNGVVVPIVPAAALYDLEFVSTHFPTAENAYQACVSAKENNVLHGQIGVGTGATVGKIIPNAAPMTGGLGYAELKLDNGVIVKAYAAVNAVGDVRDASGKIIAGARLKNGDFGDCENYLLKGESETTIFSSNTTLVAIFTNAKFSKSELKRIAKMAAAGIARAISPVFTLYDGDLIFCVSIGDRVEQELVIGTMAAEVTRQAIVNAVKESKIV